jgi:hypothetical protein
MNEECNEAGNISWNASPELHSDANPILRLSYSPVVPEQEQGDASTRSVQRWPMKRTIAKGQMKHVSVMRFEQSITEWKTMLDFFKLVSYRRVLNAIVTSLTVANSDNYFESRNYGFLKGLKSEPRGRSSKF